MESIIHFRKQWITVMIQGVLLQSFVSYLKYKVKLNSNQHVGDIFGIYVMLDRWSLESPNFHITMKVSTYIKYRFWKKINKCESFIESLVLLFSFFFTLFFYVYCSVTSVVSDSVRPLDSSPPGSPTSGILQARTLEWVVISFPNAGKWKVKVKSLSRVQPSATPWTAAFQAPPSNGIFQARVLEWDAIALSIFYVYVCIYSYAYLHVYSYAYILLALFMLEPWLSVFLLGVGEMYRNVFRTWVEGNR